jgi:hypothetical protein
VTRNRATAKKAGSAFESQVAEFLSFRLADDRIERRVKHGSKDTGDIGGVRTLNGGRVVIEAKNTARDNLPAWIREAEIERGNDDAVIGVVAHKKHGTGNPADQYISMTLETFAVLLEGGRYDTAILVPDDHTETVTPHDDHLEIPAIAPLPISPDCRDGNKHRACTGSAWDFTTDTETVCSCTCHQIGVAA